MYIFYSNAYFQNSIKFTFVPLKQRMSYEVSLYISLWYISFLLSIIAMCFYINFLFQDENIERSIPVVHRVGCNHSPTDNQRNISALFTMKAELQSSTMVGTCYSHFLGETWLHLLPTETMTTIAKTFIMLIIVYYITCAVLRTLH